MADDQPADVEAMPITEEAPQTEVKSAASRKKSLGGLDAMPVVSGPRQRKKAADIYQPEVKDKAEFVIKPGKGTKLGDIPNVHYMLNKYKGDDELISGLHSLLFRRVGVAQRRKRNILEFSGLVFDEGEREKELDKMQEKLNKWTIALINSALDSFDLPRGNGDEGKKEAKVERLLMFLEEPKKLSNKDLAALAAKKRDAAKAKREKEQKNKTPKSAAKGGRKSETESAKKRKKDASEDEAEPSEGFDEIEAEEEQPKKRVKKDNGTAEKKPPSATKASGRKRKSGAEPQDAAVEKPARDNGSDKGLPSDEEIKEATLAQLKVSDVNKVTVKDLLEMLKEKFGKDLKSKKPLVKQVAVDYAKSQAAADAADDNTDAAEEGGDVADASAPDGEEQAAEDEPDVDEEAQANELQTAEAKEAEVEKAPEMKDSEEPEVKGEAPKLDAKPSDSEPEAAKEPDSAGDAMQTEEQAADAAPAEVAEEGTSAEADDKPVDA